MKWLFLISLKYAIIYSTELTDKKIQQNTQSSSGTKKSIIKYLELMSTPEKERGRLLHI